MHKFIDSCRSAKSGDLASAVAKALGIMSVFVEEHQKQFQEYADAWMVSFNLAAARIVVPTQVE